MYSPTRSNNFRYVCHYHLGKMYVFVNLVASFAIIQFLYKHFLLRKRRNIRNPLADDDGVRPPRGVELKMPIGRFPSPWRRERRRCRERARRSFVCHFLAATRGNKGRGTKRETKSNPAAAATGEQARKASRGWRWWVDGGGREGEREREEGRARLFVAYGEDRGMRRWGPTTRLV